MEKIEISNTDISLSDIVKHVSRDRVTILQTSADGSLLTNESLTSE